MNLNQQRLYQHLSNSPLGVIEWDQNFILRGITERVTQLTGYHAEQLTGKSVYDLAHSLVEESDLPALLDHLDNLKQGKVLQNRPEFRLRTTSGEWCYTRWYNSVIQDESGRLHSIFSLFEDMTEQKRSEQELSQKAGIIDASSDLIFVINPEGRVIRINPAGTCKLGLQREEQYIARSFTDFIANCEHHRLKTEILPELKQAGHWKGRLLLKDIQGQDIQVHATIQSHFNEEGDLESYSTICRDISSEIEFNKKLAEREQQLKLAMEAGEIGTWSFYPRINHCVAHDSWITRELGYPREMTRTAEEWADLMHPEDLPAAAEAMEKLLDGRSEVFEVEVRMKSHCGKWKWVYLRARVIERDDEGAPVKISGIQCNIDGRKQTQKALEENEKQYRLLAENSTDVISRHLPDGTYTYISPAIKELTGFEPNEIVGANPFDFIHPEDLPALEKNHNRLLNSSVIQTSRFRKRTKDGNYIWVESKLKTIKCPKSGEVQEIQSTTRDITSRIRIEHQLEDEKQFIQNIIESLPGIFYMLDDEANYVYWNKNFEQNFGYSGEELRKKHPLEFYRKEDHQLITDKIKEAGDTGEAEVEADVFDKSGTPHRYYLTGKGIIREGRKYIIGTGIDISERKAYEAKLEQALNEKNVLLQEIHHRVKNNLAVISSFLQLQSFTSRSPEVQQPLLESHQRILTIALIHEKLYQSENFNRINFEDYTRDLLKTIQQSLDPGKNVNIEVAISEPGLNLNQSVPCALIINELVNNAFKHAFTSVTSPYICITGDITDNRVIFNIRDNGVGLPEGFCPKKVNSLGYKIIQKLSEQLEAELDIQSRNGTQVSFSFIRKNANSTKTQYPVPG